MKQIMPLPQFLVHKIIRSKMPQFHSQYVVQETLMRLHETLQRTQELRNMKSQRKNISLNGVLVKLLMISTFYYENLKSILISILFILRNINHGLKDFKVMYGIFEK